MIEGSPISFEHTGKEFWTDPRAMRFRFEGTVVVSVCMYMYMYVCIYIYI